MYPSVTSREFLNGFLCDIVFENIVDKLSIYAGFKLGQSPRLLYLRTFLRESLAHLTESFDCSVTVKYQCCNSWSVKDASRPLIVIPAQKQIYRLIVTPAQKQIYRLIVTPAQKQIYRIRSWNPWLVTIFCL